MLGRRSLSVPLSGLGGPGKGSAAAAPLIISALAAVPRAGLLFRKAGSLEGLS